MFESMKNLLRGRRQGLTCAVVTPVGPGHADLSRQSKASVESAWRQGRGAFSVLHSIMVDDTAGTYGRSRARNIGVEQASGLGADWLFFLDADDVMAPGAFNDVASYLDNYDAVWGLIAGQSPEDNEPYLRIPQILGLDSIDEVLLFDPFLTLQMGHFVRASVARETRFSETMNAGEDFDYYLRVWRSRRCVKTKQVFFVNQHSRRSTGPKAASAEDWGAAVRERLLEERVRHNLLLPCKRSIELKNARVTELQDFCRQRDLANHDNYFQLSRQMPYRGYFDVTDCEGGGFVLYTNNDDLVCASLAWTGEYEPLSAALWQALAKTGTTIFDIGAYSGYYGFLAARAAVGAGVHCVEPLAENYARLRLNIELNGFKNIRAVHAAAGESEGIVTLNIYSAGDFLTSGASIALRGRQPVSRQSVKCVAIDAYVERHGIDRIDLARIDVEGHELAVVIGMKQTIARCRPDLLIEILDGQGGAQLSAFLRQHGYSFYTIHDSRREIEATPELAACGGNRDLNRLASVRAPQEVAQMAREVYGRPLNFA